MSHEYNINPVRQSSPIQHFFTYGSAGVEIARAKELRLADERRNGIAALRATPDRFARVRSLLSTFLDALPTTIGAALLRGSPAESPGGEAARPRTNGRIRTLDPERSVSR